jgi:hypothetical protein
MQPGLSIQHTNTDRFKSLPGNAAQPGDGKIFFLESVIASLKPVFLSVHSILAFLEQHDVVLHLIMIAPSALMKEVTFVFHCDMRTEEHDCMVGHQLALLAPI